jgi:hypothetical protein
MRAPTVLTKPRITRHSGAVALLLLALALSAYTITIDLRNTLRYGGTDMRGHVVGARLLARGLDPYYYLWAPGDAQELLDPVDFRVTLTPALLWAYGLVAEQPYPTLRFAWLLGQWSLLCISLAVLARVNTTPQRAALLFSIALLAIAANPAWRLHVERGQLYIVWVAILAAAYAFASRKTKRAELIAGALIGVGICLRPPLALLILPMFLLRRQRLAYAASVATMLSFAFFLAVARPAAWKSYMSTMLSTESQNYQGATERPEIAYPAVIEGLANLKDTAEIHGVDASIRAVAETIGGAAPAPLQLITALLTAVGAYATILHSQSRRHSGALPASTDLVFISGSALVLVAELFVHPQRFIYIDVQMLVPTILIGKHLPAGSFRALIAYLLLLAAFTAEDPLFGKAFEVIGEFALLAMAIGAHAINNLLGARATLADWTPITRLHGEYTALLAILGFSIAFHFPRPNPSTSQPQFNPAQPRSTALPDTETS